MPRQEGKEPTLIWNYTAENGIRSSAHFYNDSIFFADLSGYVYRIGNGSIYWKTRYAYNEIWSSPIIDTDNGYLYITDIGNKWITIRLEDGNHRRSIGLSKETEFYSTGVLYQGTLFHAGGGDNMLHAEGVSIEPQNYRWGFDCGYPCYSNPVIHDNKIIFNSKNFTWCLPLKYYDDDHIIERDDVLWSAYTNDSIGRSSPLIAGGNIFTGSGDGKLYCFDEESGDEIWTYQTDGPIISSPALYNKHIYFGSINGSIYCIGERPIEMKIDLDTNLSMKYSEENKELKIIVSDIEGSPIEDASITIFTSLGHIADQFGTQPLIYKTNEEGELIYYYFPPSISVEKIIEIKILCEKEGYISINTTIPLEILSYEDNNNNDESKDNIEKDKISPIIIFVFVFFFIYITLILSLVIFKNIRKNNNGIRKKREV